MPQSATRMWREPRLERQTRRRTSWPRATWAGKENGQLFRLAYANGGAAGAPASGSGRAGRT
jgi:hypothetical protein